MEPFLSIYGFFTIPALCFYINVYSQAVPDRGIDRHNSTGHTNDSTAPIIKAKETETFDFSHTTVSGFKRIFPYLEVYIQKQKNLKVVKKSS